MGTKYTTESITGYNSSPPSDDGSATEANKVKWSTIKAKLPDPLKTAIENIDTKLVNMVDVGVDTYTTSAPSIGASDNGKLIALDTSSNSVNPSLAAAATLGDGWECSFILVDATNDATITTNSTETINGVDDGVVLTRLYQMVTIKCNGSQFYVVSQNKLGVTAFAETLLDDSDAATARTTLGVSGHIAPADLTNSGANDLTAVDISTSIPATVKRIDVLISEASTNGTDDFLIQIGSSSYQTSSYSSAAYRLVGSLTSGTSTSGFLIMTDNANQVRTFSGIVTLSRVEDSAHKWVMSGQIREVNGPAINVSAGEVTLSGELDRLRITTAAGTDLFDNGEISIQWFR